MLKKYRSEGKFDIDLLEADRKYTISGFQRPLEEFSGPIPLLYQAGYLTIKDYFANSNLFRLDIPNSEVRVGLMTNLIPMYTDMDSEDAKSASAEASAYLRDGDCDLALKLLQTLLAGIPFMRGDKNILDDVEKTEAYYHRILYFFFSMLNNQVSAEVRSSRGAADVTIKTPKYIYIFEIKINSTPDVALAQINEKGYAQPFMTDGRKIIKVGINFSTELRTLDAWKIIE